MLPQVQRIPGVASERPRSVLGAQRRFHNSHIHQAAFLELRLPMALDAIDEMPQGTFDEIVERYVEMTAGST